MPLEYFSLRRSGRNYGSNNVCGCRLLRDGDVKTGKTLTRKLLLWDIDGTILHTGKAGESALGRAMEMIYGIQRGLQGLEIAGRTDKWIVEQLLARDGKPHGNQEVARFLDQYVEFLAEELPRRNGGLHPGVLGILEEAHQRPELVQALLTGNIEKLSLIHI